MTDKITPIKKDIAGSDEPTAPALVMADVSMNLRSDINQVISRYAGQIPITVALGVVDMVRMDLLKHMGF